MSDRAILSIDAGTLFTPTEKLSPARLLISGGSIEAAGSPGDIEIPAESVRIDASDLIVAPGFIDPHVHGCGGVDVMDGTYDSLNAISRILARHGTTSFLPTTVSSPPETLTNAVERIGSSISRRFEGATPLGIHLEGPFIHPDKRGTHKRGNVVPPNIDLFEKCVRASGNSVRLLTLAPELEGADALIILAQHLGVTVAMGHSNATLEQARAAADRGICYAVHTFNAMRTFSHRDPGIAGAVLADDRIFAEIIADGVHVHPSVVQLFARAKGRDRVLLATDAISATDMPDGRYHLGSDIVEVVDGVCRDDEGRLAGSTLTQEVALKHLMDWTGWTVQEALLGLTQNPSRALKLHNKGSLKPGADADLAVFDKNFRIIKTFVAGKLVFNRDGNSGSDRSDRSDPELS